MISTNKKALYMQKNIFFCIEHENDALYKNNFKILNHLKFYLTLKNQVYVRFF